MRAHPDLPDSDSEPIDWAFLRRLLIGLLVVAIAYGAWRISGVLLLIFAAMLLAIVLDTLAGLAVRHLHLPERAAVPLVAVLLASLVIGFLLAGGSVVATQIRFVFDQLPDAFNALGKLIGIPNATEQLKNTLAADGGGHIMMRAVDISYTVIGILADTIVVVVAAVYLASDPSLYRRGVARLFPPNQHARVIGAMNAVGRALRQWLFGQFIGMLVIGSLSGFAFWLIGVPSALALGLIAGLANFVPLLGPVLGAIPAVLLALTVDLPTALWTFGAVLVVQQLEGHVITPLVQQRTVALPPAVAIFALAVFGVMFGALGIALAVPLAVAAMVLVDKLWVRETLAE